MTIRYLVYGTPNGVLNTELTDHYYKHDAPPGQNHCYSETFEWKFIQNRNSG